MSPLKRPVGLLWSTALMPVTLTGEEFPRRQLTIRERANQGPYGSDLQERPIGPLYLYLTESDWAEAWINGGKVPCNPARKYLGARIGTTTPDEVLQERWDGACEAELAGAIRIGAGCKNIQMHNAKINGRHYDHVRIDRYEEDALLLCFSSIPDRSLMQRLNKSCCVEIVDFAGLLSTTQTAFGNVLYGYMKYTHTSERSHFIRSAADEWMQEYRIVIPGHDDAVELMLPAGIARKVDVSLAA